MYNPHYFTGEVGDKRRSYEIKFDFAGNTVRFVSSDGVFSKTHIDPGTKILLKALFECMEMPEEFDVLDLGCGYGVIGIIIAKMRPKANITMVDVNPIAIRLARKNVEINGLSNVTIIRSDLYSQLKGRKFDFIVSNPPLAAGYKVVFSLIEGAKEYLKENGSIILVLKKGHNTISRKMAETFGNVNIIIKKSGYRVFQSIKR
ncbi:MAG: methyltransferase [Candidatus Methanomethyliaceae archaeon]|nr:methyltransferase [Candidatus Methanomethyliaceae archaeon]MDW7970365.1 methyltransferase [Nitrososphaerota archaeon]